MILIRPAAEEPPRVPVDARDVHPAVKRRIALLHEREALLGKRLERSVHILLKLILVRQKPRALIIKGKLPEKLAGLFAEALKHAAIPSFCDIKSSYFTTLFRAYQQYGYLYKKG